MVANPSLGVVPGVAGHGQEHARREAHAENDAGRSGDPDRGGEPATARCERLLGHGGDAAGVDREELHLRHHEALLHAPRDAVERQRERDRGQERDERRDASNARVPGRRDEDAGGEQRREKDRVVVREERDGIHQRRQAA